RQTDVEADRFAAALARAAIRRFHDPRPAARCDDETVVLGLQRQRPRRQHPRELARFLVVARPLERLAALPQLALIVLVGVAHAARPQRLQRALRAFAAVDARRSEEDDGVLNLLILEAPQRLEVLRQDADRPGLGALEELQVQIRHQLLRHNGNLPSECYDPPAPGAAAE